MSQNIDQIYIANPITTNAATDLMYIGQSPYGSGDDAAIKFSDFATQFGTPYTASALTSANDTNITITLGGTPNTALLEAVSLTMGWTGTLSPTRGGTGVNNGSSTFTIGGNFALSGAYTFIGTLTNNTTVTFPTSGTLATTSQLPTPAALTSANDTNVTLTLGGTPSTALLEATSLTMGWTGTLSVGRGGLGISTTPTNGQIPIGNGTDYTAATLTQGTGITITNALGSITIAAAGSVSTTFDADSGTATPSSNTITLSGGSTGLTTTASGATIDLTGTLSAGHGGTGLTSLGTGIATALGDNLNGTGALAGTTSPVFVTPTLGAATATSLTFSPTTDGIVGTNTNDNASSGYVGEYITSQVGTTNFTTTNTPQNMTSISLTAGDWDVYSWGILVNGNTVTAATIAGINTTSATLPSAGQGYFINTFATSLLEFTMNGWTRISVSSTSTVYLVGQAGWTGTAATFQCQLSARRVR